MATPGLIKAFPDLDPKVVAKHARKACFTLLVEQGLTARPITFFSGSPLSDDLEMEQPSWRRYLSNFAVLPEPLTCWGGRYPTVEHAFHAAKYLRCAQPTDLATKAAADFECEGVLGDADGKMVKQAGGRKGMSERGCSLDLGRWDGGESEEVTQQLLELRWTIDPTFRSILHE
eukprot:CAMPEP_0175902352 /NCGR_PEP_ID=MMETSP0108-20121206/3348_1 /TAXON_ID=195067 ORGANISM="Goniomonas pacifica, Strain CCMP1869" /NCGR_SAMPLE_ID=MMETSP0108 /ASSEMBLY_ACC=CAM_ASM_000204 /LENGTH=173 /DNA_ID=CAMNT_0017223993 /DNA_START=63 /DNA_END=581 /DNA_ORIENTATION=+